MRDSITAPTGHVYVDLDALENAVRLRTDGRVRFVDVRPGPEGVIELRGLAPSWHLKSLAGAAVRAALPAHLHLDNLITVDS